MISPYADWTERIIGKFVYISNQQHFCKRFTYECQDLKVDKKQLSHKNYNLRWTNTLGQETFIFNPSSILGAKLNDGSFKLYRIYIDPKPWLEPIEVYESIGSGQYFASLGRKVFDLVNLVLYSAV